MAQEAQGEPRPRFVADGNVGRLARRLRMLGFDTRFEHPVDDGRLVEIARDEGRVLLTRDTRIFERRLVASGEARACFVRGDEVGDQLRQVVEAFGLEPLFAPFSRCLECNTPLRPALPEEASLAPPYVRATQTAFTRCPGCGRLYWGGTHRDAMLEVIDRLHEPADRQPEPG
jgi:uncharacterized protein with PIN domain